MGGVWRHGPQPQKATLSFFALQPTFTKRPAPPLPTPHRQSELRANLRLRLTLRPVCRAVSWGPATNAATAPTQRHAHHSARKLRSPQPNSCNAGCCDAHAPACSAHKPGAGLLCKIWLLLAAGGYLTQALGWPSGPSASSHAPSSALSSPPSRRPSSRWTSTSPSALGASAALAWSPLSAACWLARAKGTLLLLYATTRTLPHSTPGGAEKQNAAQYRRSVRRRRRNLQSWHVQAEHYVRRCPSLAIFGTCAGMITYTHLTADATRVCE